MVGSVLCADGVLKEFFVDVILEVVTILLLLSGFMASVVSFNRAWFFNFLESLGIGSMRPYAVLMHERRYQIYAAFFFSVFIRPAVDWGCGHLG
jgi:hypothetical protein